ncbi:SagB-type dehydrogenase domain protein [Candidatus Magnetoovum chiemensis]|nr:SagB-type dehydrogenase domain protein [Candidatus Magnetoovum chiemensis]
MENAKYRKVIEYHERTKHQPNRYAKSAGYLDWESQPLLFRQYEAAPSIKLPLLDNDLENTYLDLYERSRNSTKEFTLSNIASFLELSLALSAWKSFGNDKWALRINPSSGNLHPTECHIVTGPIDNAKLPGGIYHYNPYLHCLERRAELYNNFWQTIEKTLNSECFLAALTSIYWREAWKYGERAFRYCNHDVGHALACISFSCNLHGWRAVSADCFCDDDIETTLGFHQTTWLPYEKEHPDLLLFVFKANSAVNTVTALDSSIIEKFRQLKITGKPNALSKTHIDWAIIDEVSEATRREPSTSKNAVIYKDSQLIKTPSSTLTAAQIIRTRRSAQNYDGKTAISKENFLALLDKTLPRNNCAPFDLSINEPLVDLLIFVHSVEELKKGLYFLIRQDSHLEDLKSRCRSEFLWEIVEQKELIITSSLPLYLLKEGDFRNFAITASCHQEIAGYSAFSLGMIAKFNSIVEEKPYMYRNLFWETGIIGQVLYLEAQARGLRGTGIGCFFDDIIHNILGLKDNAYQSLYHFTVGGAIEDRRVSTLSPYHHL